MRIPSKMNPPVCCDLHPDDFIKHLDASIVIVKFRKIYRERETTTISSDEIVVVVNDLDELNEVITRWATLVTDGVKPECYITMDLEEIRIISDVLLFSDSVAAELREGISQE